MGAAIDAGASAAASFTRLASGDEMTEKRAVRRGRAAGQVEGTEREWGDEAEAGEKEDQL